MATNRSRRTRQIVIDEGITEVDYLYYTFGDFFEAEQYGEEKTEDELRAFFMQNQPAIMGRYMTEMQQRGWVGVRPWSWWFYAMPEPQRQVEAKAFDSLRVWNHQTAEYEWVEDDVTYLSRLNLLEPWEKTKLEGGQANGR